MLNVVAIMGRLVADPVLKTTQNGINVVSFRIACDRNVVPKGEQRKADFIDIVAWRGTADFVCRYFRKGSPIIISGSIQTRQYQDKNGYNRTATEIVAQTVNFAGGKKDDGAEGSNSLDVPPPPAEPPVSYSQGGAGDFAVVSDDEDLPF